MARLDNTGDMEVLHIGGLVWKWKYRAGVSGFDAFPENVYYLYRFTLSSFNAVLDRWQLLG